MLKMHELSKDFSSLPGDGYIPTNIIFFLKNQNIYLCHLKLNGLFLVHCLICYLKASKKHILNCK
jgi:hypothetical protein